MINVPCTRKSSNKAKPQEKLNIPVQELYLGVMINTKLVAPTKEEIVPRVLLALAQWNGATWQHL